MRKALIYCFLPYADRILLSFQGCCRCKILWKAIKARFGGKLESIKKMQKNLFIMLELHDATVSMKMQVLKFLEGLQLMWHMENHMFHSFLKRYLPPLQLLMMRLVQIDDEDAMEEIDMLGGQGLNLMLEPVTYAMRALMELNKDDWRMGFDAEHVHFGLKMDCQLDLVPKESNSFTVVCTGHQEEDLKDYISLTWMLWKWKESQEKDTIKTSPSTLRKLAYVEELQVLIVIVSHQICDKIAQCSIHSKECLFLFSKVHQFVDEDLGKPAQGILARRLRERTVRATFELLHLDLFGTVSVESDK
ncbi:hypothetical protein Tco_0259790 [Tanacetum coccineum]